MIERVHEHSFMNDIRIGHVPYFPDCILQLLYRFMLGLYLVALVALQSSLLICIIGEPWNA